MNNRPPCSLKTCGFTLIELIVVISLISVMLFFSFPKIRLSFLTDEKETIRWILLQVKNLKEKAVEKQQGFSLHIDIDAGKLWYSSELMNEEEIEAAEKKAHTLPEDMRILDVEFWGREPAASGVADISFYKKGYSDKAIIHIDIGADEPLSFFIEPFLTKVRMVEEYIGFEE